MLKRFLVFVWAGLWTMGALAEVIPIDNATLAQLMAKGVPLVDIRTEGEWRSTGVIDGSRTLTFFDERGQANPAAWLEQARRIAPPDKPLILVCRSGARTQRAAQYLSSEAGYRKVYSLSGGLNGWVAEGRPLKSLGN